MPPEDLRIAPKVSLDPMPERPTILDFFRLRFSRRRPDLPFAPAPHMVQSALRALRSGAPDLSVDDAGVVGLANAGGAFGLGHH
jgi:hypothetical protein